MEKIPTKAIPLKVVVTGAESTGKTTLSQLLATALNYDYLEEYSRAYLSVLNRPYIYEDLLSIAKGQYRSEIEAYRNCHQGLICDTSLIVMKVWSLYKYGQLDPWIDQTIAAQHWDAFILTHWDIPYEVDPLRENPEERHILHDLYVDELNQLDVPYRIMYGTAEDRLEDAIAFVNELQKI